MALTARQEVFVLEYLKDLNATQAAIRAGYSEATAYSIGHENLSKPEIADAIAEHAAKRDQRIQIDTDFVLKELHGIANMDTSAMFEEDGTFKSIHDMPPIVRKVISGFEIEELYGAADEPETELEGQAHGGALKRKRRKAVYGRLIKVKMWSKDKALELLARHKSLLNDKVQHEHTGKDGEPLLMDETAIAARMDAIYAAAKRRKLQDEIADLV